ncbi:MAG: Ldh family oxidoreductase, partial [Alphaproteobacteria bacterium]
MRIHADKLTPIVAGIFEKIGSPPQEARLVADSLVQSNLKGHDSHGVGLVATYIRHFENGLLKPGISAELVKDDGAILMFDGRRGFGRRVGGEAMDAAVSRSADTGVVLMTLRNAHHVGRIGAYGEIAMAAGLVSVQFVNVTDHAPSVAPWGGAEPRFVTNPVCIAVPGTENTPPTILDMATSKIALGRARVAMSKGEQLGPDLVID